MGSLVFWLYFPKTRTAVSNCHRFEKPNKPMINGTAFTNYKNGQPTAGCGTTATTPDS